MAPPVCGILANAMPFLPTGKLPADLLRSLLDAHAVPHDPRVIVGARVGEDAAVISATALSWPPPIL